jgi:hypothetical protein
VELDTVARRLLERIVESWERRTPDLQAKLEYRLLL